MPYYETRVEKELLKQGRIKGIHGYFDYDFLEESMNRYYKFVNYCFNEWLRDTNGLVNISKWARNYLLAYSHFFDPEPQFLSLKNKTRKIISESNMFFIFTMKELASLFESENIISNQKDTLNKLMTP
jgi:hypothetical protein